MKHLTIIALSLLGSLAISSYAAQSDRFKEYAAHAHALDKENKKTDALIYYKKALEINPHDSSTLYATANVCRDLELFQEAAALYSQAMALEPRNLQLVFDAANMFNMTDELDTALTLYKKILAVNPLLMEVLYNYGYTLKKKGLIKQSIAIYQRILAIRPDYAHPHFSLALAYLSLGEFEKGWKEYEWRWKAYNEEPKKFSQPRWTGENVQGKTILLYAEQGLGDSFQFIRYAQLMHRMGARVIFQAQPPLKKILSLCPYLDSVIAIGEPLPTFDYHLPLMSCPLVFNTVASTIPHEIPYLYADRSLESKWKKLLANDKNFKIGICWQGNANYSTQFLRKTVAAKSMPVRSFEPLCAIQGITLYSLQKINGTEQLKELDHLSIKTFNADFDEKNGRFMDSAAVIKNLDLVITIDTSIGHFAAALGTPTWIMLPNPADWRWMINKNDTPWYPNVRLFTQQKTGDWDSVVNQVVEALKKEI